MRMVEVKLYFNENITVSMSNEGKTFVNFVKEIFNKKIYISLVKDNTQSIAINTDNVLFIEEVK